MIKVHAEAKNGNYDIYIGAGLLNRVGEFVRGMGFARATVVTDQTVHALYGARMAAVLDRAGLKHMEIVLPPGEETKCADQLHRVYERLAEYGMNRGDLIIAFGGGVIGDLAGFAASTYMRGTGFMQVPTTLLAQVDSSVGGKVAINMPAAKNMIGSFFQPDMVLADIELLQSLPSRQFSAGMAEVIKYAAIADETLVEELLSSSPDMEKIICRSLEIKSDYVQEDPLDKGRRMELNFGHTLGHAVEVLSGFKLLHGEAVAVGMAAMAKLGENMKVTEQGTYERICRLIDAYHLPRNYRDFAPEELVRIAGHDKKSESDGVSVIMLERMGKAVIRHISRPMLAIELEKIYG